ncbi:hypothetical protein Tco_0557952 [Tanacetum coccineum]
MATLVENVFAASVENQPPMLEKGIYNSWKSCILLYIEGKENREMLLDSINNGSFQFKDITVSATKTTVEEKQMQELKDLTLEEKTRKSYDIKTTNIILLGESLHSYYLRYAKLINDMNIIKMTMTKIQINTKFMNHLQPEWNRFVTAAKQAKNLHEVNFNQLYAYLKQDENDANGVRGMRQRFLDPLSLLSNNYSPPPSYNKHKSYTAMNLRFPPTNNQLRSSSNLRTQATIQDGKVIVQNGEGHIARQCTAKKMVKDAEWFKEKMLLAQAQEADCDDLQLNIISIFKANHVDAFDSDYDEASIASAIFMTRISPTRSSNGDDVIPTYDSDILSELPHYDTYHETDYD